MKAPGAADTDAVPGIDAILEHLRANERQARLVVNMVPSENSFSPLAKVPMLLDVYHRYFFNADENPDDWNFRGGQQVALLETRLALPLLRHFTRASYVNLRPLSGLSGMAMVLSALGGKRGSRVLTVAPGQGGHYATAGIAARLGLEAVFMTGPDAHSIDFDAVPDLVAKHRPSLVYVDQSNCLFPLDVARLVKAVRSAAPETLIHIDCSHWLGLVFGGQFPNPLELGADSFGGSTHKSFPGPQKAVVATNRVDLKDRLYSAQFEMISSHHFAEVICLGIALLEFRDCGGAEYAANVVGNTKLLGRHLHERGVPMVAAERGFSRGHQLWIRPSLCNVDARSAGERLYNAGIRVNVFPDLPGIPEPCIRIGVNEITYHGLQPDDVPCLADIFSSAFCGNEAPEKLAARTAELRLRYSWPYSFAGSRLRTVDSAISLVCRALAPERYAPEFSAAGLVGAVPSQS